MTRRTIALATVLLFAGGTGIAATQDELRSALVGNTFQGDMGGGAYSSYFAEDGTYHDAAGSGRYEITGEGVCYPDTDFGCYQAEIEDAALEWMQDGGGVGTGTILEGDPLGFGQ